MPTTVTIPKATLQPGTHVVGPHAVPAGVSSFTIDAKFSQATGAGNSVGIYIERSTDSGGSWQRFAGGYIAGGCAFPDADGNDWMCAASFYGGDSFPAMSVRMVVDVVGAALTVSGGTLVVE